MRPLQFFHSRTAAEARRPEIGGPVDVWERWTWFWHGTFYANLALVVGLALLDDRAREERWAAILGLAAAFAFWYAATVHAHPDWCRRGRPMLVYFAGALGLLVVGLYRVHPAYFFMSFSLYGQVFRLWPICWAIPGAAVLTALLALRTAELSGAPLWQSTTVLVAFCGALAGGSALAIYIEAVTNQSMERRRLIEELQSARQGLAAEERRAGTLEERQRLAREIHDTLAQGFSSIVMQLEAADALLPAEAVAVRARIDRARQTARESLSEARNVIWALRPELLERGASLREALARLTERWSAESGVRCDFRVAGVEHRLPPEVEITHLRAARELLANVRKHAGAGRVALTLTYMEDRVTLDVRDDGQGFAGIPEGRAGPGAGFGLKTLREQVEQLGGQLVIESEPGSGAAVMVALPPVVAAR